MMTPRTIFMIYDLEEDSVDYSLRWYEFRANAEEAVRQLNEESDADVYTVVEIWRAHDDR